MAGGRFRMDRSALEPENDPFGCAPAFLNLRLSGRYSLNLVKPFSLREIKTRLVTIHKRLWAKLPGAC